ncbi:hypothetical protein, variant 1, partial [Aphanomyces invadans]
MHVYFSVDQRLHGVGPVKYAWDPTGNFLASTGSSRVVHIFDRRGELVDQIVPPSPSICTHVVWSNSRDHKVHGLTLAVTQANSSVLVLWSASTQTTQHVDVGVKEITLLLWNKGKSTTMEGGEDNSVLLAIGTSKGQVVFYDMDDLAARAPSQQRVNVRTALSKHKKKILCGDWNSQNEFAFGSEDRQVSICYGKDGSVVDQVKIKAAPVGIQFGGRQSSGVKRIVSVNMGRETILLYDLNEKDNALELAFQARYGDIVDYRWFGAGYIIAGFSVGYVVVISTHMNEIGQEQYCAKFHDNWLHAICYNEINGMVATCGDACIKVVRMVDWKEIAVESLHRDAAAFDDLNWTADGVRGLGPCGATVDGPLGCRHPHPVHPPYSRTHCVVHGRVHHVRYVVVVGRPHMAAIASNGRVGSSTVIPTSTNVELAAFNDEY